MYSGSYYSVYENKAYLFEYDDAGNRHLREERFVPYFYKPCRGNDTHDAVGYDGVKLKKVQEDSFFDYINRRKREKERNDIYEGSIDPINQYILDRYVQQDLSRYKNHCQYGYFDIETEVGEGMPDPENPEERINAITFYSSTVEKYVTLALENDASVDDVVYKSFDCEEDLIRAFVRIFRTQDIDILTGWNIDGFDIPYLINRAKKLNLGDEIKRLSPIEKIEEKKQRAKDVDSYNIALVSTIDYMDIYKSFSRGGRESYSLDYISKYELDTGKLEYEGSYKEFYQNNWQKFIEYNIIDVKRLVELEEELGYLDQVVTISYTCKIPFNLIYTTIKKINSVLLSYLKPEGRTLPDTTWVESKKSIPGGYVKESDMGAFKYVSCFDIASLYPNIMMQFNISPEVKIGSITRPEAKKIIDSKYEKQENDHEIVFKKANDQKLKISYNKFIDLLEEENWNLTLSGAVFDNKEENEGIIPKVLDDLYSRRKKIKARMSDMEEEDPNYQKDDNLQYALKITMNSTYGYMATKYSPLFDYECACGITLTGQSYVKNTISACEKWFTKYADKLRHKVKLDSIDKDSDFVKACDTDSVFVHTGKFINDDWPREKKNKICDLVNDVIFKYIEKETEKFTKDTFKIDDNKIEFDLEYVALNIAFLTKKRYIYIKRSTPDKLGATGYNVVRSDTPALARDYLKETCKVALKTESKEKTVDLLEDIHKEFMGADPVEIAYPTSVNGIEKYDLGNGEWKKGTSIHIKAAILYNHLHDKEGLDNNKYERITEGGKMRYCYIKKNPIVANNCIGFTEDGLPEEFGLEKYVDYQKMFEKILLKALKPIFRVFDWSIPSFNTHNIDDFFE